MSDEEDLTGSWRLVSARAHDRDEQELEPPYGPEPMGRLVLTASGRMMAVLCDGRKSVPAGVERAYASYCGNYEILGDELRTIVDAALIPERIGGVQKRRFELSGGLLFLFPPRRSDGEQRVLTWEREGPA